MKRMKIAVLTIFLLVQFVGLKAQSADPLFQSDSVLKITIRVSFSDVLNDLEIRNYHKAKISYKKPDGSIYSHKAKVKVRGNNRAKVTTCRIPPLKVNFNKGKTQNSVFEGQNKIKLVTHCNKNKNAEQLILKEYLTYKLYQQISPYSFNVRLCEITYINSTNEEERATHFGFFIEDVDHMAARNGMLEFEDSIANQEVCRRIELDKFTVFQYMIGNLDWSVPNRHNVKLINDTIANLPVAVPYDFDFAGFVGAPYATPPIEFGVPSVKTRFFMGLCRTNGGYDSTFDFYRSNKTEIIDVVKKSTYLNEKNKKNALNYLESFFTILEKPKQVESKIIKGCRADHTHIYQYEE